MTSPSPITYRFGRADCWRLGAMLFRPSWKRRLGSLAFMVVCMLAGLLIARGQWPSAAEWSAILRSPYLMSLIGLLLLLSQFIHYLNVVTVWLRFRGLAIAGKDVALTLGPDSLEARAGGTHSVVPWASFVGRTEESDRVFLRLGRWEALTIPKRAYPDDASWRQALAFLREKVPNDSF